MSWTISPTVVVRPRAIACALASGLYFSRAAAASTRSRSSGRTVRFAEPLIAREAVASETPASLATSLRVVGPGMGTGEARSCPVAPRLAERSPAGARHAVARLTLRPPEHKLRVTTKLRAAERRDGAQAHPRRQVLLRPLDGRLARQRPVRLGHPARPRPARV